MFSEHSLRKLGNVKMSIGSVGMRVHRVFIDKNGEIRKYVSRSLKKSKTTKKRKIHKVKKTPPTAKKDFRAFDGIGLFI